MTLQGFQNLVAQPVPAPATLLVTAAHFSARWDGRPREDLACGVRPLTGADDDYCRKAALRYAWQTFPGAVGDEHHDQRTDAFNDALMRFAISRATCDPNDARRGWDVWRGVADDVVHVALTREGTKAIYDAIERATLSLSPVRPELRDDELDELIAGLREGLERMPRARAARARRLLRFVLDEVRAETPKAAEAPAAPPVG